MDKNTFLKKLEQMLSVLQEDELKDIISEYEQHIDLRVQSGLSEAEAIRDFGSLSELTADILNAYHVRADYAQKAPAEKKRIVGRKKKSGKELLHQKVRQCREAAANAIRHWKSMLSRISALPGCRSLKPSSPARTDGAQPPTSFPALFLKKSCRSFLSLLRWIKKALLRAALLCLRLARWSVRFVWNTVWTGLAALFVCLGLLSLFLFGILMILTIQQYPMNGIMIGCLGTVLCMFSAAGLSVTFVRKNSHRHKPEQKMQYLEIEGGQYE